MFGLTRVNTLFPDFTYPWIRETSKLRYHRNTVFKGFSNTLTKMFESPLTSVSDHPRDPRPSHPTPPVRRVEVLLSLGRCNRKYIPCTSSSYFVSREEFLECDPPLPHSIYVFRYNRLSLTTLTTRSNTPRRIFTWSWSLDPYTLILSSTSSRSETSSSTQG